MAHSMQDQLDAFRAEFMAKAPQEVQALMDETEAAQAAAGLGSSAPRAGQRAPSFTLPDQLGRPVALSARLPAVVVFYRGGWCPYCSIALRAWQEVLPEMQAAGISLLAISPQTPDVSLDTAEKNGLAFEVLSDEGSAVAAAYGIAFTLDARLAALYERFGHPLPRFNGTDDWRLPLPGTFAIDESGVVRAAHAEVDYRVRMEPRQALDALLTAGTRRQALEGAAS